MSRRPSPALRMETVRRRLAAHRPRALPLGAPLTPDLHPRAIEGSVLDRRAAVAAILREGERGPEVLLIRRAEHPDDPWSGHMAFPGGREELGDRDLKATAVRETAEEIALDLCRAARPLGRLDDLPAIARGKPTGMLIAPYVFEVQGEPELVPNYEVAEVVWGALSPMLHGELDTTVDYRMAGETWRLPAFDCDGRIVWGLTYQMLHSLFSLLRD